jgi:hypothetical protein
MPICQRFDYEFALDLSNRKPDKLPDSFGLVCGKFKRMKNFPRA